LLLGDILYFCGDGVVSDATTGISDDVVGIPAVAVVVAFMTPSMPLSLDICKKFFT